MPETETTKSVAEQLLFRESERQAALVGDDMEKLASLLCDDLVHVHTSGSVQGKTELLAYAGGFLRFLVIDREALVVRQLAENVAVMTGPMTNTVCRRGHSEKAIVKAFVTQVWLREGEDWKVASFHAVRTEEMIVERMDEEQHQ